MNDKEMSDVLRIWNTFQRIGTAPKDGRDLLLYCKAKGAYVGAWSKNFKSWIPKYIPLEECETCSAWVPEPKYWCELPQKFHM